MYRQIQTITLTALLAAGLTASTAFAQDNSTQQAAPAQDSSQTPSNMPGGQMRHMPNPDRQLKQMTKHLNLSSEQQIKPLLVDHQQQVQQLMQDQSLSRQDRMQKMRALNQDHRAKIEAVLNDQQKQQFEQMMQRRQDRMGAQPGNGAAPPPQQ